MQGVGKKEQGGELCASDSSEVVSSMEERRLVSHGPEEDKGALNNIRLWRGGDRADVVGESSRHLPTCRATVFADIKETLAWAFTIHLQEDHLNEDVTADQIKTVPLFSVIDDGSSPGANYTEDVDSAWQAERKCTAAVTAAVTVSWLPPPQLAHDAPPHPRSAAVNIYSPPKETPPPLPKPTILLHLLSE
ncbi:unnamed protein product [Pleuronectes platessa]|uniref:Uncharacterized protein n=1 Tax=Pleuronectes platessa TaxID=8262 RepID=A0A9N7Z243_PLEPL|nr:unnamed protein product [Pleuronectes platessa]